MRPLADPPDVGATLRRIRQEAGFSQEGLAARAGFHRTYIGQLERGERQPTIRAMTGILDVLDVSWSEFGRALDESRGRAT